MKVYEVEYRAVITLVERNMQHYMVRRFIKYAHLCYVRDVHERNWDPVGRA